MQDVLITIPEAAAELRINVDELRQKLFTHELPGIKLDPENWLIPSQALQDFIDAKKKAEPAGEKGE